MASQSRFNIVATFSNTLSLLKDLLSIMPPSSAAKI